MTRNEGSIGDTVKSEENPAIGERERKQKSAKTGTSKRAHSTLTKKQGRNFSGVANDERGGDNENNTVLASAISSAAPIMAGCNVYKKIKNVTMGEQQTRTRKNRVTFQ